MDRTRRLVSWLSFSSPFWVPFFVSCGLKEETPKKKKVKTSLEKALMFLSGHKAEAPKYLWSWYALLAESYGDLEIAFSDYRNANSSVVQQLFCEWVDKKLKVDVVSGSASQDDVVTPNERAFFEGSYGGVVNWEGLEKSGFEDLLLMAVAFFATSSSVSAGAAYKVDLALYEKEDPSRLAWAVMAGEKIERDVSVQKKRLEALQEADGSWKPISGGISWLATAYAVSALKGALL